MNWWFRKQLEKLNIFRPLLPGLLMSGVVIGLMQLGAWEPAEAPARNALMRLRGPQPWNQKIVVVGIDDDTLRRLGQFPLSRTYYTKLLEVLTEAQSTIIVLDLLLSEPSPDDADLANAIANHGGVVLARAWGTDGLPIYPNLQLEEVAIATGHIQQSIDPDGVARHIDITIGSTPALSVAAAQAYSLVADIIPIPSDSLKLLLNWPGPTSGVTYASLADVVEGQVSPNVFEGNIVLVGATATGLDQIRTPLNNSQTLDGVYVHAVALQNLLQRDWLRVPPETLVIVLLVLVGPLVSWGLQGRPFLVHLSLWLFGSVSWVVICLLAIHQNYALPVVAPLMLLGLTEGVITLTDRLRTDALLQARSEFLNTMSHEIRTPLNAMIGVSEMLKETQLTARQREFTDTVYNSGQTLMALINDVLDFSKIESGKLLLERHPVNLRSTIEQSFDIIAPRAADKQLELVYSIDPSTPQVIISDPVRLTQILLNLLSNAVKFTEEGEVSLQVRALPPEEAATSLVGTKGISAISLLNQRQHDNCAILFSVRDSGIGIPSDRVNQLFKPFSQASASTARKYGGTGLGLSISKRLSETLGGKLWVSSQVGHGSIFSFLILTAPDTLTPQSVIPSKLNWWQDKRILIIDKNEIRRTSLSWQLQSIAIQPILSRSVAEALVLIQQGQQFDTVLLDAAATRIDIASAMNSLRHATGNPKLPFVVMATLRENPSQSWPKEIVVLWKPIKQSALYRALMRIDEILHCAVVYPEPVVVPEQTIPPPSEEPQKPNLLSGVETLKILIADDNRVNQRVAQHMLSMLGFKADTVSSGQDVLDALKKQSYDVILMDMRMPEMDGLEATRQIRKLSGRINQPWIIAMTANAVTEDRDRCIRAGMNDYLSKPIRRDVVLQALNRYQKV